MGLAVLVLLAAYLWVGRIYTVSAGSMSPTLHPGDRVLATRIGLGDLRRGDVVVVDVSGTWAQPGSEEDATVVKRIVGLPGERVECCDAQDRITVDGEPLEEPYLGPGGPGPSFDVVVPAGRLWLLGDDREGSLDSRDHLGSPGGGSVGADAVQGRVVVVAWPPVSRVERPAG
ncbi:MAG: signal peptidase I [Acidimicrobiales bacterium]